MSTTSALPRSQIRGTAKGLVLTHGASNCIEFGTEIAERHFLLPDDVAHDDPAYRSQIDALVAEMVRQARRVYAFLGYDAPWSA